MNLMSTFFQLPVSDRLYYGGIIICVAAGVLALVSIAVFVITKKRLNRKLKDEYGEPKRYS